ncbi:General negative regulator of transcription subunit 4 [Smittium culicis]|uniref:General negative regulator of transcription subunit 4 n=1 Tax=Smittium culicis TaxID=133412 RepID=A0A1R1YPS0_9FUNG|nr:General negative regulator of transcription subunit 4 [Smittium culicis]
MSESGDDIVNCPLCMEEMDLDDLSFYPCECDYQICRFCYHRIIETFNGKCPACRRLYSEKNVRWKAVSPEMLAKTKAEKKAKEREKRELELGNKKHLANVRVIQRNLAYVVGLPPHLATEEILKGSDYFGQFGKINKIVINKKQVPTNKGFDSITTVGAYVTFASKDDTAKAIQTVDGSSIEGRMLRATYGTTKYCSYYLKGIVCQNPNCMYLHEPGEEADYSQRDENSKSGFRPLDSISSAKSYISKTPTSNGIAIIPHPPLLKPHLHSKPSTPSNDREPSQKDPLSTDYSSHSKTFASIITVPASNSPSTSKTKTPSSECSTTPNPTGSSALPATASWGSKLPVKPTPLDTKRQLFSQQSATLAEPLNSSNNSPSNSKDIKSPSSSIHTPSIEAPKLKKATVASILKSGIPNSKTEKQPWGNNIHPNLQQLSRERKEQLKRQTNKSDFSSPKSKSDYDDINSPDLSREYENNYKSNSNAEISFENDKLPDPVFSASDPMLTSKGPKNESSLPTSTIPPRSSESHVSEDSNNPQHSYSIDQSALSDSSTNETQNATIPNSEKSVNSSGMVSAFVKTSESYPEPISTNVDEIDNESNKDDNTGSNTSLEPMSDHGLVISANKKFSASNISDEPSSANTAPQAIYADGSSGDSFIKSLLSPVEQNPIWPSSNLNNKTNFDFNPISGSNPQSGISRIGNLPFKDYSEDTASNSIESSIWGNSYQANNRLAGLGSGLGSFGYFNTSVPSRDFIPTGSILNAKPLQNRVFSNDLNFSSRPENIPTLSNSKLQWNNVKSDFSNMNSPYMGSRQLYDNQINDSSAFKSIRERSRFGFAQNQNQNDSNLGTFSNNSNNFSSLHNLNELPNPGLNRNLSSLNGFNNTKFSPYNNNLDVFGSTNKSMISSKLNDLQQINYQGIKESQNTNSLAIDASGLYSNQFSESSNRNVASPHLKRPTDIYMNSQNSLLLNTTQSLTHTLENADNLPAMTSLNELSVSDPSNPDFNQISSLQFKQAQFRGINSSNPPNDRIFDATSHPSQILPIRTNSAFLDSTVYEANDSFNKNNSIHSGQDPIPINSATTFQDPAILQAQLSKPSTSASLGHHSNQHLANLLARLNVGGNNSLVSENFLDVSNNATSSSIEKNSSNSYYLSDPAIMSLGRNNSAKTFSPASKQNFYDPSNFIDGQNFFEPKGQTAFHDLNSLHMGSSNSYDSSNTINSKKFHHGMQLNNPSNFGTSSASISDSNFFHNSQKAEPPEKKINRTTDDTSIDQNKVSTCDSDKIHPFTSTNLSQEQLNNLTLSSSESNARSIKSNLIQNQSFNSPSVGLGFSNIPPYPIQEGSNAQNSGVATNLNDKNPAKLVFSSPINAPLLDKNSNLPMSKFPENHINFSLNNVNNQINNDPNSSMAQSYNLIPNVRPGFVVYQNLPPISASSTFKPNFSSIPNGYSPSISEFRNELNQPLLVNPNLPFESKILPTLNGYLSRNLQHSSDTKNLERKIADAYKEATDFEDKISSFLKTFSISLNFGEQNYSDSNIPKSENELGKNYKPAAALSS